MKLLLAPLLLMAALSCAHGTEVAALLPGEAFVYRVGWGIFSGAGEVKVSAVAETLAGSPGTRVTTLTRTQGTIGLLYAFTGQAVAHFSASNGLMLNAQAETAAGSKRTQMAVTFDYAHSVAKYVDLLHPARSTTLVMPAGRPLDLITVLIQARAWNLKPGETHAALVLFDNEFYPVNITAQRLEKIDTPKGPRDAMLLVPVMSGTPKGMFKKGGAIQVWISNDADRLPLKFEVKVKVGTAVATLIDYHPPSAPAPKS